MYTPEHFKMNDRDEIFDFIHKNSFAVLVSNNKGRIKASHIPVLLKSNEGENGCLYGHVANANDQLKDIDENVLVIFHGAHKYISPQWYENDQAVPTWNYLSVHVYGNIEILDDRKSKKEIVKDVVSYFESNDSSYRIENLKDNYLEGLIRGITAFKIKITEFEGKKKISQNHPQERQQRVIDKLEFLNDENSVEIAKQMKINLEKKSK